MRSPTVLVGVLCLATACEAPPDDELVTVTVSSEAEVDSFCEGDCAATTVDADVYYENDTWLTASDSIEIAQYRIDYDLEDVGGTVPWFADTADLTVTPGQTGTLTVTVAGTAQRTYVYDEVGGIGVSGTATLSLAGYDRHGKVLLVNTTFDVKFANVADEDGGSDDTGTEGR